MTKTELTLIIESHNKWLNCEPDGRRADLRDVNLSGADLSGADLRGVNLSGADLRGANLSGADLRVASLSGADLRGANLSGAGLSGADLRGVNLSGADLRGADLRGAVIDFSCLPLWCGSLGAFFDDRQIIQLVYHTVKSGLQSKNTSEEVKNELTKLIDLANRFHRVSECGKITVPFDKPLTSR